MPAPSSQPYAHGESNRNNLSRKRIVEINRNRRSSSECAHLFQRPWWSSQRNTWSMYSDYHLISVIFVIVVSTFTRTRQSKGTRTLSPGRVRAKERGRYGRTSPWVISEYLMTHFADHWPTTLHAVVVQVEHRVRCVCVCVCVSGQ